MNSKWRDRQSKKRLNERCSLDPKRLDPKVKGFLAAAEAVRDAGTVDRGSIRAVNVSERAMWVSARLRAKRHKIPKMEFIGKLR
jgi:hypothetical protein